MARAEIDICALRRQVRAELQPLVDEAIAEMTAASPARITELEQLVTEILGQFQLHAHVGQPCSRTGWVADTTIARWRERLGGEE